MQRDFALRAAFDYYFPDLLGALVPVPADYLPNADIEIRIARALAANPVAMQSLLRLYGAASEKSLAPVIAFITYDIREMQQRTHGNPFGNCRSDLYRHAGRFRAERWRAPLSSRNRLRWPT